MPASEGPASEQSGGARMAGGELTLGQDREVARQARPERPVTNSKARGLAVRRGQGFPGEEPAGTHRVDADVEGFLIPETRRQHNRVGLLRLEPGGVGEDALDVVAEPAAFCLRVQLVQSHVRDVHDSDSASHRRELQRTAGTAPGEFENGAGRRIGLHRVGREGVRWEAGGIISETSVPPASVWVIAQVFWNHPTSVT